MKKNGCKLNGAVFNCTIYDCDFYKPDSDDECVHETYSVVYRGCTNKAAQREAMNPKTRWTSKPAKKEGWYWIRTPDGQEFPDHTSPSAIKCGVEECLRRGFKRSVKPLKEGLK